MSQDPPAPAASQKVFFDRETIGQWIASCDPQVPIDPDDPRYVDFEKFDETLRGEDHITGLYDGVTLQPAPSCQLFSGFSGTGKTTELRRLKKLLQADGYVVLTYSGGHIRMLIVFVQELLYGAARRGLPPSEKDVERAVQPFREQAQMAVRRSGVPILDRVLRTGSIASHDDDLDPMIAQFLDDFIVLCYRNGDGWYEVHPLVRDYVRELAGEIGEEAAKTQSDDG